MSSLSRPWLRRSFNLANKLTELRAAAAVVGAACTAECHRIRRWWFPWGWAWGGSRRFPAGARRWRCGRCPARATAPARWATDGEPAGCWAEASSACSSPTPAGWSLWKDAWLVCRGWGSGRCWWAEWIWPPRSWWYLRTRGERSVVFFFWLNSMFLTWAPCGDKGQEKVFVLKLRVINENPFHPAADRLQEKRLTKFCVWWTRHYAKNSFGDVDGWPAVASQQ